MTVMKRLPNAEDSYAVIPMAFMRLLLIMGTIVAMCPVVRAASAPDDVLLRALQEEMDRSKAHLKMENVPAPYYIEYRVTELDAYEAS
ncbi:MAG: hypothetical protein ABSD39_08470, partial [Terriglobales bacterium]